MKCTNTPPGEPMDEEYELLDSDYFGESDEEDEELENSVAEEDKNHPDIIRSNNEHPLDVHANNDIEKDPTAQIDSCIQKL